MNKQRVAARIINKFHAVKMSEKIVAVNRIVKKNVAEMIVVVMEMIKYEINIYFRIFIKIL
jgi:hypothetical protein